MGEAPFISIVLPVYNQGDHIKATVLSYVNVLDNLKHRYEILLVVNASRDNSLDVCNEVARSMKNARVFYNEKPGWGRAVRVGLEAASGEIIAYTNSARTAPYTLASLTMLGISNPKCVIKAQRKLRYPLFRRIGSVTYNLQCRALFNLAVWDINGTPKVFHRGILDHVHLEENGDLVDLEFLVKCSQKGYQILDVPVVSSARHGGDATTNIVSALKMYYGAYRLKGRLKSNQDSG